MTPSLQFLISNTGGKKYHASYKVIILIIGDNLCKVWLYESEAP